MEFDIATLQLVEVDWYTMMTTTVEFDFMTFATGNDFNIFAYIGDFIADYLYDLIDAYYIRGTDEAPEDGWNAVFGEVYRTYYRQ